MKLFLIVLALGFASPDKLDRAYLPPPGAPLAGGSPGVILAPPEIPDITHGDVQFGIDGSRETRPIGQSTIVPITTTSYAFTQTTTYPPIENYEITAAPIDSTTGLPVQIIRKPGYPENSQNYPIYIQNQGQNIAQTDGSNQQESSPTTYLSGNQYAGTGIPVYNQLHDQYTNQYPNSAGNKIFEHTSNNDYHLNQQAFTPSYPSTRAPSLQYNEAGSERTQSEEIYSRPSMDIQNNDQLLLSPGNKNPTDDLKNIISEAFVSRQNQFSNNVLGTTPAENFSLSSLEYTSSGPIKRLERPQAETDRNAVIINYENVRTPTGYFYNYDTSNGIHADENGSGEDGTRAQGSYSYIGDDGKNYSVIYTADENGFQPRGEHLPTPPPVPEAIQKVIEQALRDKEAGIFDDGLYDEERYGHQKYVQLKVNRVPQIKKITKQGNSFLDDFQNKQIRPISKITEDIYDDDELPNNPLNVTVSSKNKVHSNLKINEEYGKIIPGGKKQSLNEENYSPLNEYENKKELEMLRPNTETNYNSYEDFKSNYPDIQRKDIGLLDNPEASFKDKDRAITYKNLESYDQKPLTQGNIGNIQTSIQKENQQEDKDGYQYNLPEVQFQQTEFPSRFKTQDLSLTMKPINGRKSEKQTTPRPFLTPEVYNQPSYSIDKEYQQSTTRRPFVSPEVDGRKSTTYNNYDVDNNNAPEQEISKVYNVSKTYTLDKKIIRPSFESPTFTSKNSPVTPISKLNSMVTSQRTNPIYDHGSTYSTNSKPTTSENSESQKYSYKYQPKTVTMTTTETDPNEFQAAYGLRIPYEQKITPQSYYTSTDLPVISTTLPSTSRFITKSETSTPFVSLENSLRDLDNGNQYEPKYYDTVTRKQPISGYTSTSNPVYQQTTFDPVFSSSITRRPEKSGTFILSGSDANTPKLLPTESYQYKDQYGPTFSTYSTTVKPYLRGNIKGSNFENTRPITPNFSRKTALGYIYNPPSSTTPSVSAIGTTPGYVSSTTTGRRFYSPSEDNDQSLVDGFRRPIYVEQQPDYPYSDQNANQNKDTDFIGGQEPTTPAQSFDSKDFPERVQNPNYEKNQKKSDVIGEDFTGPKQTQRFDPATGYYY